MIIIQTPLRVSLFGGGTDFKEYYETEGGCALSTAIDKYIFVTIKQRFDDKLRVGWTQTDLVDRVDDLQHTLIREAFRMTGIERGIEVTTMGDIPSQGSGLGSSSTVTVGTLHAIHSFQHRLVSAETLARQACEIEIDRLKAPIGIQDQYIAAYGGFRFFEFNRDGGVYVNDAICEPECQQILDENLLLFFTGITRQAETVLVEQKANINDRISTLNAMKELAWHAFDELKRGNVDRIGTLLNESWELKKGLASKISNEHIDDMYDAAIRAGAIGGKVAGAGGGGFLLLYCPKAFQAKVRYALRSLQELPIRMEPDGSKVIFNYRN